MRNYTPEAYQRAKPVLDRLNTHRGRLSSETYFSIKSLALCGQLRAALQWLRLVLEGKVRG